MSKKKIPTQYFSNPLDVNMKWSNSFVEWLRVNETTEAKTLNQTSQILRDLFSLTLNNSKKAFNDFVIEDIKAYVDLFASYKYAPQTIANQLSCISKFCGFMVSRYPQLFAYNFLEGINTLRKPFKAGIAGQPLNLIQLSAIREYRKYDLKSAFCFELFLQLDIKKKDVELCSPANLNKERWIFEKDGKEVSLNQSFIEFISSIENYDDMFISSYMVNNYLKKIANFLKSKNLYDGENITLYDIEKTREKFFVHCPNCNLVFECSANNWVLARTESDTDYHIVCNVCKGRPQYEN